MPLELHDHRPRLWTLDHEIPLNFDHWQMGEHVDLETIPLATTPKRNREETNGPIGSDDSMENQGDSRRLHVDSHVTAVNQFFEHGAQRCMSGRAPTDVEMDKSVRPEPAQPTPVETLEEKLTLLTMEIQSGHEEFIKRHRIW